MLFNFFWAVQSESTSWLSLDQFVDKICGFSRPTIRNILFFNLNLLRQYVISNLFSIFTLIRSFAKHTFVCDHTHSKVVHCNTVILSTHDLWSHIAWRSRCVFCVIWVPDTSNTQVSYSKKSVFIENQIFRFDISVQNTVFMQVLQTQQHTCDEEF